MPSASSINSESFRGDGPLVEFHSIVEAVRCALEVQHVKSESRGVDEYRLEFRIGIKRGDVSSGAATYKATKSSLPSAGRAIAEPVAS